MTWLSCLLDVQLVTAIAGIIVYGALAVAVIAALLYRRHR